MVRKDKKRYFSISVVAKMLNVHQQTLRIYEKEGLIKPARTRGNTRLFSDEDIEDIKVVLRLTNDLGVNLAGVGVILELRQKMEDMEREYQQSMQNALEEMTRCFMTYLQSNSNLPVLSFKQSLIIKEERNIDS